MAKYMFSEFKSLGVTFDSDMINDMVSATRASTAEFLISMGFGPEADVPGVDSVSVFGSASSEAELLEVELSSGTSYTAVTCEPSVELGINYGDVSLEPIFVVKSTIRKNFFVYRRNENGEWGCSDECDASDLFKNYPSEEFVNINPAPNIKDACRHMITIPLVDSFGLRAPRAHEMSSILNKIVPRTRNSVSLVRNHLAMDDVLFKTDLGYFDSALRFNEVAPTNCGLVVEVGTLTKTDHKFWMFNSHFYKLLSRLRAPGDPKSTLTVAVVDNVIPNFHPAYQLDVKDGLVRNINRILLGKEEDVIVDTIEPNNVLFFDTNRISLEDCSSMDESYSDELLFYSEQRAFRKVANLVVAPCTCPACKYGEWFRKPVLPYDDIPYVDYCREYLASLMRMFGCNEYGGLWSSFMACREDWSEYEVAVFCASYHNVCGDGKKYLIPLWILAPYSYSSDFKSD